MWSKSITTKRNRKKRGVGNPGLRAQRGIESSGKFFCPPPPEAFVNM